MNRYSQLKESSQRESPGVFYGCKEEAESRDEIREKVDRIRKRIDVEKERKADIVEYKGRLHGYVIVPDEVVYAGANLTHAEFRLWVILRKHAKEKDGIRQLAFPGRKRLAHMMGIKSLYRISELIKSLEGKGILLVQRPYLGKTNRYTVKDPPRRWFTEMKKELKKMIEGENQDFPERKY